MHIILTILRISVPMPLLIFRRLQQAIYPHTPPALLRICRWSIICPSIPTHIQLQIRPISIPIRLLRSQQQQQATYRHTRPAYMRSIRWDILLLRGLVRRGILTCKFSFIFSRYLTFSITSEPVPQRDAIQSARVKAPKGRPQLAQIHIDFITLRYCLLIQVL